MKLICKAFGWGSRLPSPLRPPLMLLPWSQLFFWNIPSVIHFLKIALKLFLYILKYSVITIVNGCYDLPWTHLWKGQFINWNKIKWTFEAFCHKKLEHPSFIVMKGHVLCFCPWHTDYSFPTFKQNISKHPYGMGVMSVISLLSFRKLFRNIFHS